MTLSVEGNIPRHVAIIMDGNGRWANERGLARSAGHRAGIKAVKEAVSAAGELGVEVVTLFAFSTENWSRPKKEIKMLMRALDDFLKRQLKDLKKNNIRLVVIGRDEPLPAYLRRKLKDAQERTGDNTGLTVVLALNYGGRQEIVDAARRFARAAARGEVRPEALNEDSFGNYLYTSGLPDPDMLIRTSGEMRISNFLLWQLSYAEFYFLGKYWPDFKKEDFYRAVKVYQERERRFGRVRR
ncbi:MAG: isoprenyl transferase [Candidatus Omnitrophota bacterium]